jgi:hypothetical protein
MEGRYCTSLVFKCLVLVQLCYYISRGLYSYGTRRRRVLFTSRSGCFYLLVNNSVQYPLVMKLLSSLPETGVVAKADVLL